MPTQGGIVSHFLAAIGGRHPIESCFIMSSSPLDPIPVIAAEWLQESRSIAIATVIRTWGSSPRPVGAQMIVDDNGAMMGSVSGGCVEAEVIAAAIDAISDQKRRVLEFAVADENAFASGLACGGEISILLEPVGNVITPASIEVLAAAIQQRDRIGLRSVLGSNAPVVTFLPAVADSAGLSRDGSDFTLIIEPPIRVVIIGAVHIAQALVPILQTLGMLPIIIDPRTGFATADRFDGVTMIDDWPDEAMSNIGLDRRTAVVALTHDPKIDDPSLSAALESDVFYIGSLGSTRTHAKRIDRLRDQGFENSSLGRIHAPVGLKIGSNSPAEIALSIAAQIVAVKNTA